MNVSQELAKHIANVQYDDLPLRVVDVTKNCIMDTIGVILAASTLGEGIQAFVKVVKQEGGFPQSTIIGFEQKVPASAAAFVNGSMAHALDFGESHDTALVHASSQTIPAALAVAEAVGGISGQDFITAVAVANDLVCRLGLSIKENALVYGWYMPPILGAFGATAAAGKVLNLSEKQLLDAFSLTLCQATCSAEITQDRTTQIRSIRDAFASRAGVTSALLAKEGVRGFEQPFEGKRGFFYAFVRNQYDPDELLKDLGKRYEGAGVSFKPWPSCRGTHPYIECALKLKERFQIRAEEVKEIKATVNSVNQMLICEPLEGKLKPKGAINAKFSLPYVLAVALVYGNVSLEHFLPEATQNREVLALAERFRYEVDPRLDLKDTLKGFLEIKTVDNRVLSQEVDVPLGHPDHPMSQRDLIQKFRNCSRYAAKKIGEKKLKSLIEIFEGFEEIKTINQMTNLLS